MSKFLYVSMVHPHQTHSFQYGFRVRLMTLVVWICSPSTETIANGSGKRRISLLTSESAATTGDQSYSI